MKKATQVYRIESQKKHSVRYEEIDGARNMSGTIYLSKDLVGRGDFPDFVKITVEEEK